MASKGTPSNGQTPIDAAIAILLQNQASFVAQLAENNRLHLEYERETKERVARIESQTAEVIRILTDHNRRLDQLTEAVRDRIGFKSK